MGMYYSNCIIVKTMDLYSKGVLMSNEELISFDLYIILRCRAYISISEAEVRSLRRQGPM